MKKIIFGLMALFLCVPSARAEKVAILYTGQTHAGLYHCNCPKEPDGGVARRMSKIKELRLANPNTLVLESGAFFAGGGYDEHSQGFALDKARTEVNLKALELMQYDALVIGDEELNFGKDYLVSKIKESKLSFISANLKLEGVKPYSIKKVGNTNIAVIGLTNEEAKAKLGAENLLEDVSSALPRVLGELKNAQADLVVVLSYLGEEKDKELLTQIKGIDLIISGRYTNGADQFDTVGASYLVRPFWQGRRLSKAELDVEDAKIKKVTIEQIRLSDQVPDAREISPILPQCFSDQDCQKGSLKGSCNNPAAVDAACRYELPKPVSLLIIRPKDYPALTQDKVAEFLKSIFAGLEVKPIDYESKEGKQIVSKLPCKLLPLYVLPKAIEKETNFVKAKEYMDAGNDYYYVKPQFSGGTIFVDRKKIFKKLDVFMGTKGPNNVAVLAVVKEVKARHKELDLGMHYLAIDTKDGFSTPTGLAELEEDVRQGCVAKNFPKEFWDYALCRATRQESTWWDVCAEQTGVEVKAIKKCSLSDEGIGLLRENIKLNQELKISGGPMVLVNNNEIFPANTLLQIELLEKILGFLEGEKK